MAKTEVKRNKAELIIEVEHHELDALIQGSVFQISAEVYAADLSEIKQGSSLCVLIRKRERMTKVESEAEAVEEEEGDKFVEEDDSKTSG